MNATAPFARPPDNFDRNLAALRQNDSRLADRIAAVRQETFAAAHPPVPAATPDGRINFRLRRSEGVGYWFGRISIPSVRAEAVLAKFDAGQGNVFIPGLGEGSEVLLLSRRLGRHRAIFVWEEDPRAIMLAMHLHDYAQPLADERIVFLTGPPAALSDTLSGWLERHPGHLCPNRIMLWPWQIPMDLADVQAAVESAYARSDQQRQQALLRINDRLAALPVAAPDDAPTRLALLAARADPDTSFLIDALAKGAAGSGWSPVTVDVRKPGDVHPLARAEKLANSVEHLPELAVLIDISRHEVRAFLPDKVPSVAWLFSSAMVKALQPERLAAGDIVAVTSPYLMENAAKMGTEDRRLAVIPPPCLLGLEEACTDESAERPVDVAIFADLGPTDAAVFGFTLTTPRNIWNTVVDLLSAQIEDYTGQPGRIEALFARAEKKLCTRIEDNQSRESMIEALEHGVAPRLTWKHIVQSLIDNDITVDIYGRGWPETSAAHIHPPATLEEQVAVLRQSKMMIHVDLHGAVSASAMLAAGNGAVLLARSHPRDGKPGGLCSLLKKDEEMVRFSHVRDLVHSIRRLLRNDAKRQKIAANAIKRCRAEHLPAASMKEVKIAASSFFRFLDA